MALSKRALLTGRWSAAPSISDACFNKLGIYCEGCRDACEAGAVMFERSAGMLAVPAIEVGLCTSCGECVSACPAGAISFIGAGGQ